MNRFWPWLVILVLLLVIGGAYLISVTPFQVDQEARVRALVEGFGEQLENVSLLGPNAPEEMEDRYSPYVEAGLLAQWQSDPASAPGRLTSSPWPDRIEIASITRENSARYRVAGDIVEVTNEGGGIGEAPSEAARRPISLIVEEVPEGWRITSVTLSAMPSDGAWQLSAPTMQGIRFMYPATVPTSYISAQEWPPLVERTVNAYSCTEGPITAADGPLKTNERRMLGDREYCVTTSAEGAAGSTYRSYEYFFPFGGAAYRIVFQLRYPQCLNYDEPERSACTAEQSSFDVDGMVDRIAQSIQAS